MNEAYPQPPLVLGTIDNKCLLVDDLATTPPKYFGDSDPRKFLMCYEAAIALSGGDEATLVKSFIISLKVAAANLYARLQP
jgi:hypothetical protein